VAYLGSGKSTFAKELGDFLGVVYFEADQYFYDEDGNYNFDASKLHRAHLWCQEAVAAELQNENSVIVANTSTTEKEVAAYKTIADTHNARFVSLIVENRHGNESVHNVPPEKIAQMRQRFSVKL
jgi:NEDD4-binding protein 2